MAVNRSRTNSHRGQKVAAIAAFGIILVSGAGVASLAAWTDTEWVQGGVGTDPGISTSVFRIQQNTTTGSTGWVDEPDSPGGVIAFVDASGLTPGDTAYGFVRLRTVDDSLAGTVTLNESALVGANSLYGALRYGAGIVASTAECSAAQFGVGDDGLVPFDTSLSADVAPTFSIAADASAERIVCFAVTLPAGSPSTLQGLTTTPEWYFEAESS